MSEPRGAAPGGAGRSGQMEVAVSSSASTDGGEVRVVTDNCGKQWKVSSEMEREVERGCVRACTYTCEGVCVSWEGGGGGGEKRVRQEYT